MTLHFVTDIVSLEYFHALHLPLYCGCHRKTPAGTLFLIFFYKIAIAVCWLYDDFIHQNLLILNQDCWSYLKMYQESGFLRDSVYIAPLWLHGRRRRAMVRCTWQHKPISRHKWNCCLSTELIPVHLTLTAAVLPTSPGSRSFARILCFVSHCSVAVGFDVYLSYTLHHFCFLDATFL